MIRSLKAWYYLDLMDNLFQHQESSDTYPLAPQLAVWYHARHVCCIVNQVIDFSSGSEGSVHSFLISDVSNVGKACKSFMRGLDILLCGEEGLFRSARDGNRGRATCSKDAGSCKANACTSTCNEHRFARDREGGVGGVIGGIGGVVPGLGK